MVCSLLHSVQRQTKLASPREPEISRVSCRSVVSRRVQRRGERENVQSHRFPPS
jgi:hypothetical protein